VNNKVGKSDENAGKPENSQSFGVLKFGAFLELGWFGIFGKSVNSFVLKKIK
jgi:hypothetical protein